jgi:hypothetical protein
MTLPAGVHLGSYAVLAPIGAAEMAGEPGRSTRPAVGGAAPRYDVAVEVDAVSEVR